MCWTHAGGFGPIWVLGTASYNNHWDKLSRQPHANFEGTVLVKVMTPCGDGELRRVPLKEVNWNPTIEGKDLFPNPPAPECGWQQWCVLHNFEPFEPRFIAQCETIAIAWARETLSKQIERARKMHAGFITENTAVYFCWFNGQQLMKHSTTEMVHFHLMKTARTIQRLTRRCAKARIAESAGLAALQYICTLDGLVKFQDDAQRLLIKSICANCPKVRMSANDSFRLCASCKRVRYCSEACQKAHWKVTHKHECSLLADPEECDFAKCS